MAEAAAETPFPPIPTGADFCLRRSYHAAHLAAHPGQIVRSIEIMGRNARNDPLWTTGGTLASLGVTFRDGKMPIAWNGVCFDKEPGEGRSTAALRCHFFPEQNADILVSEIEVTEAPGGRLAAEAHGDWKLLRSGEEPDGSYGEITTYDRTFLLDKASPEECRFLLEFWTAEGATEALRNQIP